MFINYEHNKTQLTGSSSPIKSLSNVDLPTPLGPTIATVTQQHHSLQVTLCSTVKSIYIKLEIWGRAQLEAARCHKSNWKDNLGS